MLDLITHRIRLEWPHEAIVGVRGDSAVENIIARVYLIKPIYTG